MELGTGGAGVGAGVFDDVRVPGPVRKAKFVCRVLSYGPLRLRKLRFAVLGSFSVHSLLRRCGGV